MSRWAKHKGRRATAAADQTSTTSDERSTDTTTDTPAGASTDGATEHRDDAVQDSALLQGAPTIAESTGVRRPSPALDIFDGTAEDDGPGDDTRTSSDGSATVIDGSGLGLRQHGRDVFTGVDVRVGAGDLVVLQGAAGSGKTSLALALAGRLALSEGRLVVCGQPLPRRAGAVRHRVALGEVRGVNDLDDALTVEQHVAERLVIHQPWWKPWVARARVQEVLDRVGEIITATDARAEELLQTALSAATRDPHSAVVAASVEAPREEGSRAAIVPLLRAEEFISDLQPLERMVLGVVLALIGQPEVLVVDDVDALRDVRDRRRAWTALAALDGFTRSDGQWQPLTVVATCQHAGPLADIARALHASADEAHTTEPDEEDSLNAPSRSTRSVHVVELDRSQGQPATSADPDDAMTPSPDDPADGPAGLPAGLPTDDSTTRSKTTDGDL